MYRIRLAGTVSGLRPPSQCFIIGPRRAPAPGRKLVPVGLASPILCLPSRCHRGGGMRLPLIVVLCFQPLAYSFAVFHQSGRTPLLPLYALFQFIAPEELTLRTLYEFDATSRTPRKTPRRSPPRRVSPLSGFREPFEVLFSPTGRHPFYFHGVLCPRRALRR